MAEPERPGADPTPADAAQADRAPAGAEQADRGQADAEQADPTTAGPVPSGASGEHRIERTRTSAAWTASVVALVALLLLLIFILQNDQSVEVSYFGASGSLPLGVALLFGALGGALLVVLVGAARILQLRRVAKRHRDGHR